jgi:polysaccharide biosynthesis transport protein
VLASRGTMAPRYATLRDYLRVVRQRRALILICTAVCTAAGIALALSQDDRYRTSSALRFTDPNEVFTSVAQTSIPASQLPQVAVQRAVDVLDKKIASATRKEVGHTAPVSVGALNDTRTSLVTIEVTSIDPNAAAKWANAWAVQARRITTAEARAAFRRAARALRSSRSRLGHSPADESTRATLTQRAATLDSAAAVVSPAEIVRRAAVPTSAYAPDRKRDAVVGLLIGLTLGLIAAFVRDGLDRRVRRPVEIESDLHAPILGHIYSGAMRNTPFVVNGHKQSRPFLPAARRRSADDAALEGFQILRTNLESLQGEKVQTVMVTSALAGEGKSTVAVGLAGAAALTGRMTLLVECDLRRPSLDKKLDIKREPGLGEYLAGDAGPNDVLRVVSLAQDSGLSGELVVIPGGAPRPDSAMLLGSARFSEFLEQVRATYDVIVLDTGPILSVADPRDIARHVDAVLLCVRSARTTRDQARAAKTAIEQASSRPAGVVVTDVQPGQDEAFGYHSYGYSST